MDINKSPDKILNLILKIKRRFIGQKKVYNFNFQVLLFFIRIKKLIQKFNDII